MNIMNKWRKHQMKIIDSWLSTKAYFLMHIFGTRLMTLGLASETERNWNTQDLDSPVLKGELQRERKWI